jgi:hypothetical protein
VGQFRGAAGLDRDRLAQADAGVAERSH